MKLPPPKPPRLHTSLAAWDLWAGDFPKRILVVGESGSGKTALFKRFQKFLPDMGMTVYLTDNANEMTNFYRVNLPASIPILPISMKYGDGVGLDIAAMLPTEADRQRFAWKMVPDIKGDSAPFWNNAARLVLENSANTLHTLSPKKYLLADIVRICMKPALQSVLSKLAGLGDPYELFGNNDSKRDVQVTLFTKLKPLSLFAAVDMRCTKRITLPLSVGPGVLVMEMDDTFSTALSSVYSFIFDTLADRYLSTQSTDPVVFVVDEFRELQPLECIEKIARRGRKSGVSLVLSMHEITGIYDRYGKDKAEELLGLLNHKIFLRIGSPSTAKWASSYLGECEVLQNIAPLSTDGSGKTFSRSVTMRPNVLPDELRRIPLPNYSKDTLHGWADLPDETAEFVFKFKQDVNLPRNPAPRPLRSPDDQILPRLTADDLRRLGISITPSILEALK
jgi:hypothetical protein